jgi:hypothetical protein
VERRLRRGPCAVRTLDIERWGNEGRNDDRLKADAKGDDRWRRGQEARNRKEAANRAVIVRWDKSSFDGWGVAMASVMMGLAAMAVNMFAVGLKTVPMEMAATWQQVQTGPQDRNGYKNR